MTTKRLLANDKLQDEAILHAHFVEEVKARESLRARQEADKNMILLILASLSVGLPRIRSRGYGSRVTKQAQYRALMERVDRDIEEFYSAFHLDHLTRLQVIAKNEFLWQANLLNEVSGSKLRVPPFAEMARQAEIRGRSLKEWYQVLARNTSDRVKRVLRAGFSEGLQASEMVSRVERELQAQLRHLDTLTRTAINHMSSQAREMAFRQDPGVLGVEWVSVMDSRTTDICASRDGNIYPIDSGPRPPAHMNCRSITVPIVAGDKSKGVTYSTWIHRQSASRQNKALGSRLASAIRSGAASGDRFIPRNVISTWTLEELASKGLDI